MNCRLFSFVFLSAMLFLGESVVKEWTDEELRKIEKQWAEQDGEEDEETEHMRKMEEIRKKSGNIDLNNVKNKSPEEILKLSKKGQPLMVFVQVVDTLTDKDAETVSQKWQQGLKNGGILVERYAVGSKRFIFMFNQGEEAFDAKSYLTEQEECLSVDIDNQKYPGKDIVMSIGSFNDVDQSDLFELCQLAGVEMDRKVFDVLITLLNLNVSPNALFHVLRDILNKTNPPIAAAPTTATQRTAKHETRP